MVSDSIANGSIPTAQNTKNMGKKKRTNRSAKLKQCKFDARREQWLSQVNSREFKDGGDDVNTSPTHMRKGGKPSLEKLEMRPRGEENDGLIHLESDLESPSNSPTSVHSCVLGSNDSGTSFTGSSSSSSSGGCYSGNISEEEEGDDGGLDDWELMADALGVDEKHQNQCSETPAQHEQTVSSRATNDSSNLGLRKSKPESGRLVPAPTANSRAWRVDDAFRPPSLPNLSKQQSLRNPDCYFGGGVSWGCKAVMSAPSSCPICFEDLDLTDSSFLPCLCGFRLCLFCHKRILEEDGRCPGCRKPYEHAPVETEASVVEAA